MNNPQSVFDHLRKVLVAPDRGVLGLVDELLTASRQQEIRLEWQAGNCFVRSQDIDRYSNSESLFQIEVPLRKSVVRAVLARIAALCNERSPDSVSPYGGQGLVAIDADPSNLIRATFVNTSKALSLELASESSEVVTHIDLSYAKSSE
jgi:hypothetical protein